MIIGIVAVGKNWEIGKKNGLLFKLPADMKRFRTLTSGKCVVCGYNTLLSFPKSKPLPGRLHIVLAAPEIERDDCIIVHTLEDALEKIEAVQQYGNADIFIIGGAMVYKSFLPYYDKIYVTKVDAEDKEATAFFPNLDKEKNYKITHEENCIIDGEYKTRYITYERIK